MKTLPAVIIFSLFTLTVWAAPVNLGSVKLRDGRELKNVIVVKIEPDGLRVEHRDGVGKIRMEDLPSDLSLRFSLEESTASAWRVEEKKRLDEAAGTRLRARVRVLMEASRAEQEAQARAQRLSIFDQAKASQVNYAGLDEQLLTHIQLWNDAGRDDLASRFEADRDLLKQQEIARPGLTLESEKKALTRRVESLQNEVNAASQRPFPTPLTFDSDRYQTNRYNPYSYGYQRRFNYSCPNPSCGVQSPIIIYQPPACPPSHCPSPVGSSPSTCPLPKSPLASPFIKPSSHALVGRPYQK